MAVILSLETSTDVCSVALTDGDQLLKEAKIQEPQIHAARLAPMISALCEEVGAHRKDIKALAVTSGPGSYTGLRIGTSTAKGICYALDLPLIAVGTLELLAYQGLHSAREPMLLCPMIDARRMEVYCMVTDVELKVLRPVSAVVVDGHTFQELLAGSRVLFFGNGAEKCKAVIDHANALFLDGVTPSAASLGAMAHGKYLAGDFEDLMAFKPFYLKEFVAKPPKRVS